MPGNNILFTILTIILFLFIHAHPATGIVSYWPFDETSDTIVVDASGNGNSGDIHLASRVFGVKGRAMSFSGTEYIRVNNSTALNPANQLTIECWANVRQVHPVTGAGQTILRKEKSYLFGIGTGGKVGLSINDSAGWKGSWTLSKSSIQPLHWNHLAGVWDGQVLKIYINGILDSNTCAANGTIGLNSNNIYIAKFFESDYEGFNGTIDELKVYDTALPADSITAHYNAVSLQGPVLIPYSTIPTLDRRPLLQWFSSKNISTYIIQIAPDESFSSPIISALTTDTFYIPMVNLPVGSIYWRVGNNTDSAMWSIPSSFEELDSSTGHISTSNLVSYFTMDSTLQNAMLMSDSLLSGGNLVFSSDRFGTQSGAILFNDSLASIRQDHYEIGSDGSLPRTFSYWTRVNTINKTCSNFASGGYDVGSKNSWFGIKIAVLSDSDVVWAFCPDQAVNYYTGIPVGMGTWMHHAILYDGATVRWFINNREVWSSKLDLSTREPGIQCNTLLYKEKNKGFFKGSIDDIRAYTRALNPNEVTSLFEEGRWKEACPYPAMVDVSVTTSERKPLIKWYKHPGISKYHILFSKTPFFANVFLEDSTADTTYTPRQDLPYGKVFVKVGGADANSYSLPVRFFIDNGLPGRVPGQYATIADAMVDYTTICIESPIVEDLKLTKKNYKIYGLDTGITITGKARIDNSTVLFSSIKLIGKNGLDGKNDIQINYCPTPGNGGDGDTAVISNSSNITFDNCLVKGGNGGKAGLAYQGTVAMMPCEWGACGGGNLGLFAQNSKITIFQSEIAGGNPGSSAMSTSCSTGTSIAASLNTIIDTQKVVMGVVVLDGSSKIIPSETTAVMHSLSENKNILPRIHVLSSGVIKINAAGKHQSAAISIYTIAGRLIYKSSTNSGLLFAPKLNRGIYLISFALDHRIYNQKYISLK